MQPNAYDLKAFYNSRIGVTVRNILAAHIRNIWPDLHDLRLMGTGYAAPYIMPYMDNAERVFLHMPVRQGAHQWPDSEKNLVAMAENGRLPFENNSIDRALMIHNLEFFNDIEENLQEVWRVLRPTGRLLVITPNRTALWAQADWTPFGKGRPFTTGQLSATLMENKFVLERSEQALFMPPLSWPVILRSAGVLEKYSRYVWPLGGVHVVEASKQLYAPINKGGSGSKVSVKNIIGVRPPVPQGSARAGANSR